MEGENPQDGGSASPDGNVPPTPPPPENRNWADMMEEEEQQIPLNPTPAAPTSAAATDPRIQLQLTRAGIISSFKEIITAKSAADLTVNWLERQSTSVGNLWAEFSAYHETLCNQTTAEMLEDEYFTENIYGRTLRVSLEVHDLIAERQDRLRPAEAETSSTGKSSAHLALKRISVPEFAGTYKDWPAFKDIFMTLIGSQSSIPAVEKMVRLKEASKGPAANLIANLQATAENYQRAWDILVNRYENKRLIIAAHLNRIFKMEKMSSRSGAALLNIINTVTEALQALEALGEPVDHWDTIIAQVIRTLLDGESLRLWELELGNETEPPKLERFLDFLRSIARAAENIEGEKSRTATTSSAGKYSTVAANRGKSSTTRQVHHAGESSGGQQSSVKCPCCQGNHHLGPACTEFICLTPAERRRFIEENRRCFNCLGPHMATKCSSDYRCRKCNGKHHTLIHIGSPGDQRSTSTSSATSLRQPAAAASQAAEERKEGLSSGERPSS